MKDHYFILGLSHKASSREIKEAFRKLCLKYHPDKTVTNPHNEVRYMEICEAYKILSNKEKRAAYDKKLQGIAEQASTNGAGFTKIKEAIYPEIQTSYKGHYPWLAAFAILLVGALAVIFSYSKTNTYNKAATGTHDQPSPKQTTANKKAARSNPIAKIVPDTVIAMAKPDTVVTPDRKADSAKKTEEVIASALQKNTPWMINKVSATADGNTTPYNEWDYNYQFQDKKLIVTYKSDENGTISKKRIVIPAKDVQTVYYSNNKIWITSKRKSIQVSNSTTEEKTNTDFFAVKIKGSGTGALEHSLSEAFSKLRSQY